ncbi:hypothetical protein PFFVO_01241 [Plasmodium falciparum Vietnam Oak-Knoll (FVO)]|uniref:Surface antigen n=1 Tax=Plasmodium falciparum Vietnam Oak-Knoll (FVO) TaxID=1036723 RepID=A0A024VCC7_PLAFA|nr:hypothetical protein PFFVO_01241 [Plasmodium falciparum Vietnam Oak-Knoll (FVO)]
MKWNYINILLFSLSLNILSSSSEVYNQRNHYLTSTPKTSTRTLCECEMYAPSNYDNDPEMKTVMQDFDRQISQRFKEYDERMIQSRQKCKDQCDKDIQKIILKDKIDKKLAEKFVTLEPNIDTNDIPTCVCEKSMADKVEKGCLRCGGVLGSGVAPAWGLISGLGYATWSQYVTQAPIQKGVEVAISLLDTFPGITKLPGVPLTKIITSENYFSENLIINAIQSKAVPLCSVERKRDLLFCSFTKNGSDLIRHVSTSAKSAATYGEETASAEAAILAKKSLFLTNTIIASFVAIVVIVLVMFIIYLILRYRRKKKMKKKLQYIKLLEE